MFDSQDSTTARKVEDGFRLEALCVDPASGSIDGPGGREQVDPKVMEVLLALARHPGELVTRAHLLDEVWHDRVVGDETLTQCVYQLRGHLAVAGGDAQYRKLVETLPKRGYRLGGNVESADSGAGRSQVVALARRPRAGLFAALVVAVAVAGGGYLAFQWLSSGGDAPAPRNSIAVLPFEDFSQDRDQGYLAHGFAEEMIDVLTRIPGLRVIARTSSFSFRGDNLDIPAIADTLDVAYLLEGSVRKVGNEIRITTQLVDAGSNTHLWSASFDRQLTDILAIQTEIARSVADTLHLTLSEPEIGAIDPPRDPEAYELYLQGQFFWNRRAPGDEERAQRHFNRAVDIDPRFARAWVALAGTHWAQVEFSEPGRAALRKMGEALDRALAIDPKLSEAHARAAAYHRVQGNERLYEAHWKKAGELGLEPGRENWLVLSYAANHAIRRGEYERALRIMERVLEIDPLSALTYGNYGYDLMAAGRYAEAKAAFDKADEFNPAMQPEHDILRTFLLALAGRHEAAIAQARDWPVGPDRDQLLAKSNYALGRKEAAENAVNRLRARPGGDTALRLAEIEASRGNENSAFDWLASINQRAIEDETRMWPTWENRVRISPCLRPLRDDPRWESMIARLPKRPLIVQSGDGVASSLERRF